MTDPYHQLELKDMADFGSTFKNARQSKGLTLDQVATKTKIGTRFLEAIEKGELERLPGGIFSRGFVRAYAETLGLDANEAVANFDRLSNYHSPAATDDSLISAPKKESGSKMLPIAVGILIVIAVVFYFATRQSATSVTADQSTPLSVSHAKPVEKPADPAPTPAPVSAPTPETSAPEAPVAATVAPAPEPAKEALAMVLEVKEATWVKVLADGTAVNPGEVLLPGATRRYTAQNSFALSLGNAGGVTVKVNDRELRSLGKSGQVRSVSITPDNLKDITE